MAETSKRASIYTLGCRLNQSETAILIDRLEQAGYSLVPFDAPADLGVINTCTVTGEADTKSRKMIRSFIRRNPAAVVAVVGCYSQVSAQAVADIEGVDLILGNQEKLDLLRHLPAGKQSTPVIVCNGLPRDDFSLDAVGSTDVRRRANLKIQEGCSFMCSYCIVPYARGLPRSRDINNAMEEAQTLVQRGVKEIVLTGINVGAYSFGNLTVVDVVDRLNEIKALSRIRVSSIELNTIPEGLLERMNAPDHALVPFLHMPLQSGSDRILSLMRRTYFAHEAMTLLEKAHRTVRDICIGTDVILGFPGESDADFEDTERFLKDSPISYAHVFKYSPRKGTPAAQMAGRVEPRVVKARSETIRVLSGYKQRAFHERFVGRTVPVLFEQCAAGVWTGYTENYIKVAVRSDKPLTNTICAVRLTHADHDHMQGTLHG